MTSKLYIFAKAPRLGKAKTRLAADIGKEEALRLYRKMMRFVLKNVQSPNWETILAAADPVSIGQVPEWEGLNQIAQVSGSLSPRLAEVFKGDGPILVIGTDCPQIRKNDIMQAFEALKTHSAVLGPADDGGFWLIGLKGPVAPSTFENVRWSHSQTLSDMEARIDGPVARLRTLIDIDDLAALDAVKALDTDWL